MISTLMTHIGLADRILRTTQEKIRRLRSYQSQTTIPASLCITDEMRKSNNAEWTVRVEK